MRCYNCSSSRWVRSNKDYECERMSVCEKEDTDRIEYIKSLNIKPGSKIKFEEEDNWYIVQAIDNRFIICTNNEYYTICDIVDGIRGADDHYGYYDYSELTSMEFEIALAQFHLKEPVSIHDLNVSPIAKDYYIEKYSLDGTELENEFPDWDMIHPLEISYRNFINLNIEEIR